MYIIQNLKPCLFLIVNYLQVQMQLQYIQCSPFFLPIIGCTDNTEYIYMYV